MKEETDYCSWRRELVACEKVLHSLTKGDCSFVLFLIYLIYYYFGYCLQERNKIGQKQTKQKKPKETTCVMKLSRCYHFFFFFLHRCCRGGEKDERQRSFVLLSFTTTVLSIAFCLHVVITGCVTAWNARMSPLVHWKSGKKQRWSVIFLDWVFGAVGTCWSWMNVV